MRHTFGRRTMLLGTGVVAGLAMPAVRGAMAQGASPGSGPGAGQGAGQGGAVAGGAPGGGAAGGWPTRPVRIIVPFTPAGSADIMARILANGLGARLGQSIVVENRSGAAGVIGTEAVVHAEPDGYTLLLATAGTGAINYALYPDLKFRPADLVAVGNIAVLPNVITVPAASPAKTLAEFVALAKGKPGGMSFGSSGAGTTLHLTGEMLKISAGIELVHVPYRGAAPMITDEIAGRVDMAVDNLPSSLEQIRSGRLRALAVTSDQRSPALPDVPTTAEAGQPAVKALAWFGIQAPAKTPRPVVERIAGAMQAVLAEADTKKRIADQGAEAAGGPPDAFERFIADEITRWGTVVRQAGVKLE